MPSGWGGGDVSNTLVCHSLVGALCLMADVPSGERVTKAGHVSGRKRACMSQEPAGRIIDRDITETLSQ